MKPGRIILGGAGVLALGALVGPLLVPIKPLEGLVPPEQLAEPDSQFMNLNGLKIHYKSAGSGGPLIVLLHGFAASTFSWRKVMAPISEFGTVIAFDRPASGLTERPRRGSWTGESPYSTDAQSDLVASLIDALGFNHAILVGHSAGGTVAMNTGLRHPDRVKAMVLVDPAIYLNGAPEFARPLLRTPQVDRLGVLVARNLGTRGEALLKLAWHDPAKITAEDRVGYGKTIQVQDWDRAIWELTAASRNLQLGARAGEVSIPVLVITGEDDRIVPPERSKQLSMSLPRGRLIAIPDCGHIPQEECPEAFLAAITDFLGSWRGG